MQPSSLPAIILLFFIKFPFSCVQLIYCLYRLNLNICLHNDLCKECLPSLLSVSIPNRCKLAETTSISQNCNEIYLKTPKSGRNSRVFAKLYAKVDKSAQFELKKTFCFFFLKKSAYFTFKNTISLAK